MPGSGPEDPISPASSRGGKGAIKTEDALATNAELELMSETDGSDQLFASPRTSVDQAQAGAW